MIYDFGGGCPYKTHATESIIVDIIPADSNECCVHKKDSDKCYLGPFPDCKEEDYICADLFSKDLKLPTGSASFINVSRLARYCNGIEYIYGDQLDYERIDNLTNNIIEHIEPFGVIRFVDYMEVLNPIIRYLVEKLEYKIISCSLCNYQDKNVKSKYIMTTWEVILLNVTGD